MSLVPIRHLGDRQVVLDDTDPNITYIGDEWVTSTGTAQQNFGSLGPVHNNTLHQIGKTSGASFKFQYSGESRMVDAIGFSGAHEDIEEPKFRFMDHWMATTSPHGSAS